MTHHYRHGFNTAILRRVAVFTLSMFESVAPLTQGQETADEEEEVLESLVDSPKAQDDKKKELEALLQEPETDGTDSDSESDADAEGGETMTATLSDSELYLLGLALDEQNRSFEQKQDGTQATTDKLAAKAIADMQATPIPVGLTRSTDSPFSGQSTEAGGPTIVEDAISHDTDETAALLISSDDDDSAAFTPRQAASPLTRSLVSTAAGSGTVAPPAAAPLTYGRGAASSGGGAPAGGGGGGASSAAVAAADESLPATPSADSDSLPAADSMLVVNAIAPRPRMAMAAMADGTPNNNPRGTKPWNGGNLANYSGYIVTFAQPTKTKSIDLSGKFTPWEIQVCAPGDTAIGNYTYDFTSSGTGYISDYVDDSGTRHATSIIKDGKGMLVLNLPKNDFSGGVEVKQGGVYVAEQGSLGTGEVYLHNGTSMSVNYSYNRDFTSSFRNPKVANNIRVEGNATIDYGTFVYDKFAGDTSRIWRNMTLSGSLYGETDNGKSPHLTLQGYTSREGVKIVTADSTLHLNIASRFYANVWYSAFTLSLADSDNGTPTYAGTLSMDNYVLGSAADSDNMLTRESGAVKINISDDYLKYAKLDMTRQFRWVSGQAESLASSTGKINNLLINGVKDKGAEYTVSVSQEVKDAYDTISDQGKEATNVALKQVNASVLVVSSSVSVGELEARFLGVTQDTYRDLVNWSETYEACHVRVVTEEMNATLTLGVEDNQDNRREAWFSGTVGLENQYLGTNGSDLSVDNLNLDKIRTYDTKPQGASTAGLAITKVGNNTQYIHTARARNLMVNSGTIGFNTLTVDRNLQVNSGATLKLGVRNSDLKWEQEGTRTLGINQRFLVYTDTVTEEGQARVPVSAVVEGNVTMGSGSELRFELDSAKGIVPIAQYTPDTGGSIPDSVPVWTVEQLRGHSLLQVKSATYGTGETATTFGGTLTLDNKTAISLSGVDFVQDDYEHNTYYLAAADKIAVAGGTTGTTADFATRIIRLHYGFYGIVSALSAEDETGSADFLVMTVATDPTRSWSGAGVAHYQEPTVWKALEDVTALYNSGARGVYDNYYLPKYVNADNCNDAQWKENRAYTDGVSVKFGNLYLPSAWENALYNDGSQQVQELNEYTQLLNANKVTKTGTVVESGVLRHLFSEAAPDGTPGNGTTVEIGGVEYGVSGSTYLIPDTKDGLSNHYEQVIIDGEVRPGYVTVNSSYELWDGTGYITVTDDTNYVFTSAVNKTGVIADATPAIMCDIYGGVDRSALDDWKTVLAKGGTGTLVIQTENTYSGGSDLHGGLTVMQTQKALGTGAVNMAYGAGLMLDYVSDEHTGESDPQKGELQEARFLNSLTVTHMLDFADKPQYMATGDAQLFNRWDTAAVVETLISYSGAKLTLRGVSLDKSDPEARKQEESGRDAIFNTYADFAIKDPSQAYGIIRMDGYLWRAQTENEYTYSDGRILNEDGTGYKYGGGNVQLTISGHPATEPKEKVEAKWEHTSIDLSRNGSNQNVLALETRYVHGDDPSKQIKNDGSTVNFTISTVFDDGTAAGSHGRIINDASSERLEELRPYDKYKFLADLTLKPTSNTYFSGDIGFGEGQNAEGAVFPSRGYITLRKMDSALQQVGNAKLKDLYMGYDAYVTDLRKDNKQIVGEEAGVLHVLQNLQVCNIATALSSATNGSSLGHILVGEMDTTTITHSIMVGKGGTLTFETANNMDNPLTNLAPSEGREKYGMYYSYILLLDGATIACAGNWQIGSSSSSAEPASNLSRWVAINKGASVTFNTHDYSMDPSVTSSMGDNYAADRELKAAFSSSHIMKFNNGFIGEDVVLNFTNQQLSAGATDTEKATQADYNGYVIVQDLNAYDKTTGGLTTKVGLSNGTVNIGAKTIVQSVSSTYATTGTVEYHISGTDAALQFTENGASGYNSFIKSAELSEGGRILLGASQISSTTNDTRQINTDITRGVDLVVTNKTGKTAELSGFKLNTANQTGQLVCGNTITVETALGGASDKSHASMKNAQVIAQTTNNLLEHTDLTNTLVKIQQDMTLYISDVTMDTASKVQGAAGTDSVGTGKVVNDRPGAQSNAYTDTATRVSVTLTQDNANTVTSNTQNKLQVMKVDQLEDVDMLGIGLTIGISQETLESYRATCDILALEVTDTGIFTYEANGVLSGVQLEDTTTGKIYATTDTSNPIAIADSAYVAYLLGVEKAQVSMNYIYIVLPEPTTGTLSLLALAALCARRRRTGAGKV